MTTGIEDFISVEEDQAFVAEPTYPAAFGVTFTPVVSGILFAVVGLAGALYLVLNQVLPAWNKYQELRANRTQKQDLVQQKESALKRNQKVKTELAQAQQRKTEVLSLFANEKNLDTLLLDLNRVIESTNARTQQNGVRSKLKRFVPVNQTAEIIADGSLGANVNGKLKRRMVTIEFDAPIEKTQSILRNIERLQPLLLVRDYESKLLPSTILDSVRRPTTITTSFQLQALIPVSPEEAAAAVPPAIPPK